MQSKVEIYLLNNFNRMLRLFTSVTFKKPLNSGNYDDYQV